MQPIVYLPQTSKNNRQNGERKGVQHSVEVSTCLNNFRHQLQQSWARGKKRII
jgi:hypothetical protein